MNFIVKKTPLKDALIIIPKIYKDKRGFFMETYNEAVFRKILGIKAKFIQDNHSKSKYGVLRGLHFQKPPYEQAKLVRCIKGKILDVIVDIRKNSPTYGKYYSVVLSSKNKKMLYIPRGFAHGFLVLSKEAEVIYKVDNKYAPQYESGIIWNDPYLNIPWPIREPILSEKDKKWKTIKDLEKRGDKN